MNAGEQLIALGRAEGERLGRADSLRFAIAAAFDARELPLSETGRARLAACADAAVLERWVAAAVTAASEADVF
jgi:hypothetical protein